MATQQESLDYIPQYAYTASQRLQTTNHASEAIVTVVIGFCPMSFSRIELQRGSLAEATGPGIDGTSGRSPEDSKPQEEANTDQKRWQKELRRTMSRLLKTHSWDFST